MHSGRGGRVPFGGGEGHYPPDDGDSSLIYHPGALLPRKAPLLASSRKFGICSNFTLSHITQSAKRIPAQISSAPPKTITPVRLGQARGTEVYANSLCGPLSRITNKKRYPLPGTKGRGNPLRKRLSQPNIRQTGSQTGRMPRRVASVTASVRLAAPNFPSNEPT